jgi:glucose-6-phosphate 1-epimerase
MGDKAMDSSQSGSSLRGIALGGQIMACQLRGYGDVFYTSPLAAFDGTAPVRGGVPVLFPQFAGQGPLPKHGLVRTRLWDVNAQRDDVFKAALSLGPGTGAGAGVSEAHWSGTCALQISAQAQADCLTIGLRVTNTGDAAVQWTGGLHPYFATSLLAASSIDGLQDRAITNTLTHGKRDVAGVMQLDNSETELLVHDAAPVVFRQPGRALRLAMTGFTEWMIWNPGEQGAARIKDLPPQDWQKFICIEPVCISQPVVLRAGEVFEGGLTVSVG